MVVEPSAVIADQEELLALLRTKGLSIKDLDKETREKLRGFVFELHVTKGVSLSDIAKMVGNKTSGYTSWLCRQLEVKARPFEEARLKGIREKRRKYERRPFDGTEEDKAYLLGLRHGDLSVSRPFCGAIRVSTSTTHPAMAELFRSLFEPYGHVYQHPLYKKDTGTYEWNFSAIVDSSFEFLFQPLSQVWTSVNAKDSTLLAYLSGILDAEGSIGIWSNGAGLALQALVYNTNYELCAFVKSSWMKFGFKVLGPYLDKEKGSITSKYRIKRRKDYWKVAVATFDQVKSLLTSLVIRHREKVARKRLALELSLGDRWTIVEPKIKGLRASVRKERDEFVRMAEMEYLRTHIAP